MNWVKFLVNITFLLFINAVFAQEPEAMQFSRKIPTAFGPEDLVLDNFDGRYRVLVSASNRWEEKPVEGSIMALNPHTGFNEVLPIRNNGQPFFFHPHGIDIVKELNGKVYLYAISHEPEDIINRHKVIKMQVFEDYLEVVELFEDDLLISPNDISARADGSFYISNDSKRSSVNFGFLMEKLFRVKSSTVVLKNSKGAFSVVGKNLAYANGVCNRNDTLWVSATQKKQLMTYRILENGSLEKLGNLAKIKGLDNLHIRGEWLYTTAHPSFKKFIKHAKPDQLEISPCDIYAVNIKTGEQKLLFSNDGSIISGASTALPLGDKVLVGQVFDDFLLELKK